MMMLFLFPVKVQCISIGKFEKEEGWGEIFRSHFTARKWSEPERLGATINTDSYECFPVVAPDEDFFDFLQTQSCERCRPVYLF